MFDKYTNMRYYAYVAEVYPLDEGKRHPDFRHHVPFIGKTFESLHTAQRVASEIGRYLGV